MSRLKNHTGSSTALRADGHERTKQKLLPLEDFNDKTFSEYFYEPKKEAVTFLSRKRERKVFHRSISPKPGQGAP